MTIIIFHNPRCSKSRKALQLLSESQKNFQIREYLNSPPTVTELQEILLKLKMPPSRLLRIKEAKKAGIAYLDENQLIEAMCQNPVTIERPIVINGTKAIIGRPPEAVFEIL